MRRSIQKITGKVEWDGNEPGKCNVVADLDDNTIHTDDEARDKHLRSPEFFDVDRCPTMYFQSTQVRKAGGKFQVVGNLTLGGQTKPVTLDVDDPVAP